MKRVLLGGVLLVVLALGVAAWLLLSRLDSLVASVIEDTGSEIAGTAVRVGSVEIDLRAGRGTIRGLRVANPEGFSSGDAFRLGEIVLDLDPATVTGSPVVIDELRVNAPEASFEVDGQGRSNFAVLKANVERHSARGAGSGGQAGTPEEPEAEGPRIRIDAFAFEKGAVRADLSALDPEAKPLEATLPTLKLREVGGSAGGTPDEIGKALLGAFTAVVVRTVAADQAGRRLEKAIGGEAGKEAGDLLKRLFD